MANLFNESKKLETYGFTEFFERSIKLRLTIMLYYLKRGSSDGHLY